MTGEEYAAKLQEITDYLLKKDPDNFHEYYDYEPDLIAIIKYFYYERLNWCGCGNPEDAMLSIAKFLEARSGEWGEREEKMMATYGTNKLWENELLLCLAYTMDAAGFTEHGGSIYSCWTDKDGEYFLWAIREAEKREELDI